MKVIRAKFRKFDEMKYISHLDMMRMFKRAFNRANIDVLYSQGYNPHPKFAFATALSVGVISEGEYMDVEVEDHVTAEMFKNNLNEVLPMGMEILKATEMIVGAKYPSLMAIIKWSRYMMNVKLFNELSFEEVKAELEAFKNRSEIIVKKETFKKGKRKVREINIKEFIQELDLIMENDGKFVMRAMLATGSEGNLKTELLLEAIKEYTSLDIDINMTEVHRIDLFTERKGKIETPF